MLDFIRIIFRCIIDYIQLQHFCPEKFCVIFIVYYIYISVYKFIQKFEKIFQLPLYVVNEIQISLNYL